MIQNKLFENSHKINILIWLISITYKYIATTFYIIKIGTSNVSVL